MIGGISIFNDHVRLTANIDSVTVTTISEILDSITNYQYQVKCSTTWDIDLGYNEGRMILKVFREDGDNLTLEDRNTIVNILNQTCNLIIAFNPNIK